MSEIFTRTEMLLGKKALEKLRDGFGGDIPSFDS